MAKRSHPRRGSMAFSPRKRASRPFGHVKSWPTTDASEVRVQGFAGWKAGMTHILSRDLNPRSPSAGQEVRVPVTVVECPKMRILGVRGYGDWHSDFLSCRGAAGVQITRENVGHTGFPACKSLHSHFTCIGCRPRLNQTKWTVCTLSRAKRHRSSSWVTFLCHVGFLLCLYNELAPPKGAYEGFQVKRSRDTAPHSGEPGM